MRGKAAARGGFHPGPVNKPHVMADCVDHGFAQLVRCAEAAKNFIGDLRAHRGVALKTDSSIGIHGIGGWFADIVEQHRPGQGGIRIFQLIERERGVHEDIAFGVKLWRLFDAAHCVDFGQDVFQQSRVAQQVECAPGFGGLGPHARQFLQDAFGADLQDFFRIGTDRARRGGIQVELQHGGEAYGAQHAEVVFLKASAGIPDGANDSRAQIVESADVVDDCMAGGIVEQAIDGEVASPGILIGAGELDGDGAASIRAADIAAEGGDLKIAIADGHERDAERLADEPRAGEAGGDLVGVRIRRDVDIFAGPAEQRIADATACKIGGESGLIQARGGLARGGIEVIG